MSKAEFIDHIFQQNWLWSYDSQAELPESIIIEHALLYGDVDDLMQLFSLYDNSLIRQVWLDNLVVQDRYRKLNTYLAKFFFRISNAEAFVNQHITAYPRLERLRLLAAED